MAALKSDRRTSARQRERAQAERTAWRVTKDWIAAQVALVEARMANRATTHGIEARS